MPYDNRNGPPEIRDAGKHTMRVLVQADMWNGSPDIDATCRMTLDPVVEFGDFEPFSSSTLMPFNSQNTFVHRDLIPYYMMLVGIERVQDIWGSYVAQLHGLAAWCTARHRSSTVATITI